MTLLLDYIAWVVVVTVFFSGIYYFVKSKRSIWEMSYMHGRVLHSKLVNRVAILIPAYEETALIKDTVEYYSKIAASFDVSIYFITTNREGAATHNSTYQQLLRITKLQRGMSVLHYPSTGFKAAQVNYALDKLAVKYDYFGVFDMDSRPQEEGIGYVIQNGDASEIMQMPSLYRPSSHQATVANTASAIYQTRWSLSYEINRWLNWQSRPTSSQAMYLVGHGLFIRGHLRLPQDTITEDLAFGYDMSRRGVSLTVVPFFDYCTVPSSYISLIKQSSRWFYGELMLIKSLLALMMAPIPNKYRVALLVRATHVLAWPLGPPVVSLFIIRAGLDGAIVQLVALFLACVTYVYLAHLPSLRVLNANWLHASVGLPTRCAINFIGPWYCIVQIAYLKMAGEAPVFNKTDR